MEISSYELKKKIKILGAILKLLTVRIYVAIIQEKVFLGFDDTFYNDFLQGIHLCKNFCNPTMAF